MGFIILLPWILVSLATKGLIYDEVNDIPIRKYGLLLGTSPGSAGRENPFFRTRIVAAQELYEKKKIEYIIVSGDNSNNSYNEPLYMKNALLRA